MITFINLLYLLQLCFINSSQLSLHLVPRNIDSKLKTDYNILTFSVEQVIVSTRRLCCRV